MLYITLTKPQLERVVFALIDKMANDQLVEDLDLLRQLLNERSFYTEEVPVSPPDDVPF